MAPPAEHLRTGPLFQPGESPCGYTAVAVLELDPLAPEPESDSESDGGGPQPPRPGLPRPPAIAELVVRYVSVGDEIAEHTLTLSVVVNAVSAAEAAGAAPDPEVREEVLILKAAKARDEGIRLADQGQFDAARLAIDSAANDLRRAGLVGQAEELAADSVLLAPASYAAPSSRKQLRYNSNQVKRRRQ